MSTRGSTLKLAEVSTLPDLATPDPCIRSTFVERFIELAQGAESEIPVTLSSDYHHGCHHRDYG